VSTRSVIARPTPQGGFAATYCHYDGYPADQGRILFEAVTGHFGGDPDAAGQYLIGQHPAGWSVLHGDFTAPPDYRFRDDPRGPAQSVLLPRATPAAADQAHRPRGLGGLRLRARR
jgi:hypothetical protein